MNRKRYNYIRRLVEKITTSPSNNMEFCYYGHLVSLQSGTTDYVDVTVYNTGLFDVIVQAFQRIYGKRNVSVIIENGKKL